MTARVVSVNVGRAAPLLTGGRSVLSAIRKRSVGDARRAVRPLGLDGDEQADLSVHGGPSKAVYMYPQMHYAFWNTLRRQTLRPEGNVVQAGLIPYADVPDLEPGDLGENLTIDGLDEHRVWIGDMLAIGSATFYVTEPRMPCFKFNARMGVAHAAKMMTQSGYCGWYLQVRTPGEVGAGDAIVVHPGDRERAVTVAQIFELKTRKDRRAP